MICVLMSVSVGYMFKSFPAYVASIGLHSRVNSRMCSEVISQEKFLSTLLSFVISFFQVISFDVYLKSNNVHGINKGTGYPGTFTNRRVRLCA